MLVQEITQENEGAPPALAQAPQLTELTPVELDERLEQAVRDAERSERLICIYLCEIARRRAYTVPIRLRGRYAGRGLSRSPFDGVPRLGHLFGTSPRRLLVDLAPAVRSF